MDKYDVLYFIGMFLLGLIVSLVLTWPIMWLWNYLMPSIFGLPTLTFWQTYGLQVLVGCFVPNRSHGGKN